MAAKRTPEPVVATNRQARRDYEVLDTWEAGIVLKGSEVKSLREAKVQLADAYARVEHGAVWLIGLHISPYRLSSTQGTHDVDRNRKLLLHAHEVAEIKARVDQERLSLIPLRLYFKNGRAKLELGLARGRRAYDKRQAIAKRDAEMDARRAMSARRRTE
jgi:SsrA-binding protein